MVSSNFEGFGKQKCIVKEIDIRIGYPKKQIDNIMRKKFQVRDK